jgi:translation elongation factor EF-Tu-like GTPase
LKFIEKVEDIFDISGRGCVIVPGIPYSFDVSVGIGAKIEIRNPSGSVVQATLTGIEMINRGRLMEHAPFSVSRDVKKSDIEIGAELYLISYEPKT